MKNFKSKALWQGGPEAEVDNYENFEEDMQ